MSLTSHAPRALPEGEQPIEELGHAVRTGRRDAVGRMVLVLADLVAVAGAVLAVVSVNRTTPTGWVLALPVLLNLLTKTAGLYDRDEYVLNKSTLDEVPQVLSVAAIFAVIAAGTASVWAHGPAPPVLIWGALTAGLLVCRGAARFAVARISSPERVLIVGDAAATARIKRKLARNPSFNAIVVGRVAPEPQPRSDDGEPVLGSLEDLPEVIERFSIDRVAVVSAHAVGEDVVGVVRLAGTYDVKVAVLPPLLEIIGSSAELDDLGGQALLSVHRFGLTRSSRTLKRTFDLIVSGLMLVALSPVLLAIAFAVRLSSGGSVIFRQTRIGRDGQAFQMMKFRTMVVDADERKHELLEYTEAAPLFKIANDPRTTALGRFLRRQSLDELPQLFNVLRGDMSIVGPRPLVAEEDRLFTGWQRRRNHVSPGITGPWQILGSSRVPFSDMVTLDYLYCANWSLWLDLKIILRTIPAILSRRGGEYPINRP
jgi:exopolysaccharide biosynthesis polyprenyl glycosylphosphotransferase